MDTPPMVFVGLGNPGKRYAGNRHNIGYLALDAIAEAHGFSSPRARFQGSVQRGKIGGRIVIGLKPRTFMNRSGTSVGACLRFYKLKAAHVTVFHDDLDLPPAKVRVKSGGGHGGHNGLRSIDDHIGRAYRRVRLGIGHPGDKGRVEGYVLHDFAKADQKWLDALLKSIADHAPLLVTNEDAQFMNAITGDLPPVAPRERSRESHDDT